PLSLQDAARVVTLRSQALAELSGQGGMMSVLSPHEEVADLISAWAGRIGIAVVNGPGSTVVSGDADALDELFAHCEATSVQVRRINVDYASHSPHVERIHDRLLETLAGIEPRTPAVPFYST